LDGSPRQWWWGNGTGDYSLATSAPSSVDWECQYTVIYSRPSLELRLSSTLLGGWTGDGLMLGHFQAGLPHDDFPAPGDAVWNSPATWARVTFGDAVSDVPITHLHGHVYDGGADHPVAGRRIEVHQWGEVIDHVVTGADGAYEFNTPSRPGVEFSLVLADLPEAEGWRADPPSIEPGSTLATPVSNKEVHFSGCGSSTCNYRGVDFMVRHPIGGITLTTVEPNPVNASYWARSAPRKAPQSVVRIHGSNLHNVVDVFFALCAGLPTDDDDSPSLPGCHTPMFPGTVLEVDPSGNWIAVQVPYVPYWDWEKTWNILVHDRWDRPGRVVWTAATVELGKPPYPLLHGFEFKNEDDRSGWADFVGVFGDNAFMLPCVPKPWYAAHFLVYYGVLNSIDGKCNGMAATSLMFANGLLDPARFQEGAYYADGLLGRPTPHAPKPASYSEPGACLTRPINVWAHVLVNHGVQLSDEYMFEVMARMRGAGLIPTSGARVSSLGGSPLATLTEVRGNLGQRVLSMVPRIGEGHVVVPYAVQDNVDVNGDGVPDTDFSRIMVYDSNFPERTDRYIEINRAANSYRFPRRNDINDTTDQWTGDGIYAVPLSVWRRPHTMPGALRLAQFLILVTLGDADSMVETSPKSHWGWDADGNWLDTIDGAKAFAPTGMGTNTTRAVFLALPGNAPSPKVSINVRGSNYLFHSTQGGNLFQLEVHNAVAGDTDQAILGYEAGLLGSVNFVPQRGATNFAARFGMSLAADEEAVVEWRGISVGPNGAAQFKALKGLRAAAFQNNSSNATPLYVSINTADGLARTAGSNVFGPFLIPPGATHRVVLGERPAHTVRSEIDVDNDGKADIVEEFPLTLSISAPEPATALVASGSTWRYLDDGMDLGTTWQGLNVDDSNWFSGAAEFGYGYGAETTRLQTGHVTDYFRRNFVLANPADIGGAELRVKCDVGAIVYLNGIEVFRSNMPTGMITSITLAYPAATGTNPPAFVTRTLSPNLLLPGQNLVAVEVHQASTNSSTLSFDLELKATPLPQPPAPPKLEAVPGKGGLVIRWPATAASYILEQTDGLDARFQWSPVQSTPNLNGSAYEVFVPAVGVQQFFRLHRVQP
jgi:hypothetical protein